MANRKSKALPSLRPNLQVSFYHRLQAVRDLYLQDALRDTIAQLELSQVDQELGRLAVPEALRCVASHGVRGEVFFAVPSVLRTNPFLLGYYRLLLGFSQKEFYYKAKLGRFHALEDRGEIPRAVAEEIESLCACLSNAAAELVAGIDEISRDVAHELQLLTLGPQFRGSENTRVGQSATKECFELIAEIVARYIKEQTKRTMLLENDSKRPVLIEFASDPDITITQTLESHTRPLVSIEIKGGTDVSNIHNRLGEAEKSHQKARNRGFFEFWTILRCDVDSALAQRESPTTSHFFHLDRIREPGSKERRRFRDLLGSLLGIRT